jgi:DNA-binding NarL/FixJ family response regulator
MQSPIRVLIVESQTLIRIGLKTILQTQKDIEIFAEAETSEQGFEIFEKTRVDVTLMSLRLGASCAIDEIGRFLRVAPQAKIIVLASHAGDAEISRSLESGAFGYICTDVSEADLLKAIRTTASGKKFIPSNVAEILTENFGQETLTPSEQKILQMIVGGKSNKQIAFDSSISENTVKTHIKNIFDKLGVSDRTSAATLAIKRGLVRADL